MRPSSPRRTWSGACAAADIDGGVQLRQPPTRPPYPRSPCPRPRPCTSGVSAGMEPGVYDSEREMFVDLGKVYQRKSPIWPPRAASTCSSTRWRWPFFAIRRRGNRAADGSDPARAGRSLRRGDQRGARATPPAMVVGMHMCRGNFKGKYLAEGGYDASPKPCSTCASVTHFLLEYDTPRAGDFAPLRFLAAGKGVVLGLVSSKTPRSKARRFAQASARRRASSTPIGSRSALNAALPARSPAIPLPRPTSAPSSRFASTRRGAWN